MKTLKLYGDLAKFIGKRVFNIDVASVGEAIRFLVSNFPQLEAHMNERHYKVKVGRRSIDEAEINDPIGSSDTISIIPVIAGAGAVTRIIVGVLLIAVSFFSFVAPFGPLIFSIGASLLFQGVASLLTPTPRTPSRDKDPREEFSFSGIQNSSRSGLAIPVCYGEAFTGSITVSIGLTTEAI